MPLYSEGLLDEIRNSVSIVSWISDYAALKKRGRNYVASCLFHKERTPSFNVNEEKQIFRCFGCGEGGDIFKFVMLMEHVSFPEAVQQVAERHGIPLPQPSRESRTEDGPDPVVLREAMAAAAVFYHRHLLESPEARGAREYIEQRGILPETVERFQLGFSPADGDALIRHLKKNGGTLENMVACGLAKRSDDGTRHYDAFRNRIMFPITDIRGRTIAFGGRALGDAQPKYLNSPETRLYNKSRNLFGLSSSRDAIGRSQCAVLVEGYMDFIVPFQYGVENLVASLGTSLTTQQVKLLGRYTREVVVCYDPDPAGLAATTRSLDLLLEEDFLVRVFQLPDGQDPDTFVRSAGPEEYRRQLRGSALYLDFVLESAIKSLGGRDDPKAKVRVINEVLPYLAKVPNAVERSQYVMRFAERLKIESGQLLAEVKRAAQHRSTRLAEAPLAAAGAMKPAEKRLLQFLLGTPELQPGVVPRWSLRDFEGLVAEKLFAALDEEFREKGAATSGSLHGRFAGTPEQALLAQVQMDEVAEDPTLENAWSSLNALRALRLTSFRQAILEKIAQAEKQGDDELLNRLYADLVLVDRELVSLSGIGGKGDNGLVD